VRGSIKIPTQGKETELDTQKKIILTLHLERLKKKDWGGSISWVVGELAWGAWSS